MPTANSGSVGRGKPFDVRHQAVRATLWTHSSQRSHLPMLRLQRELTPPLRKQPVGAV